MNQRQALRARQLLSAGLTCAFVVAATAGLLAQNRANERVFPQSKAAVEKALKTMQSNLAGRLPVLDGFASSDRPLDHYQRGYYQANVEVSAVPGGSLVRISAKVTAWYSDPTGSRSGYQLLPSNGRLEADLLDQLTEQVAKISPEKEKENEQVATASSPAIAPSSDREPSSSVPANSAPASKEPSNQKAATGAATNGERAAPATEAPNRGEFSSSLNQSLQAQERASQPATESSDSVKSDKTLQAEADGLEEILKNQSRPKNLVAVRKSGTAVAEKPSLTAKPLFLASLHDEFEMLDFNEDWVHVRISGLSRGWIWRNSLEMPEGIPDTAARSASASPAAELFHVMREETAAFPGDWPPLRGKNVKILSVQKIDDNTRDSGPQAKLEYAKYLLEKNYAEMAQQKQSLAGIVLVFDSADGGMIAATLATLQQWKAGSLSDAALWHNCFFDPPETFSSAGPSGTQ
jgi:hypothetical protein